MQKIKNVIIYDIDDNVNNVLIPPLSYSLLFLKET